MMSAISRERAARLHRSPGVVAALAVAAAIAFVSPLFAQSVSFRESVAPILVKRCLACHGELKFKGEYQLHTFETLMMPGESGDVSIVPAKPDGSYLLELIASRDAGTRMPKNGDKLADGEVDLIRRWIAEGAKFDGTDAKEPIVQSVVWKHPDPVEAYPRPFPVTAMAFRPDGQELAIGGHYEITVWNVAAGTLAGRIKGVAERTYSLAYNADGTLLAAASGTPAQNGEVKLFHPADGRLVRHLGSMADCALGVAFSPDGKRLVAGGADQMVRVYDVDSGKQELLLKDHSDWVMGVAFSPKGDRLATASRDKTCKVFDGKSGALLVTYSDHGAAVHAVAFNADGSQVISGGGDNRMHFWHAADQGYEDTEMKKKKRQQIGTATGFGAPVFSLTQHGGQVFACSADMTARQFDAEKRTAIRSFTGHGEWLFAVAYCQQTRQLAAAGLDGQVRIWNTAAKDEGELTVATFFAAPGFQPAASAAQATGP
jgi:hypothetical protein